MKKIALLFLTLCITLNVMAQHNSSKTSESKKDKTSKGGKCPKMYISTSTGINNCTGLLGIALDAAVGNSASIEGGAGLSTWGYKLTVGGKYYFKPCHRGWALGGGLTHNTGLGSFTNTMETAYGTQETVILKLKAQTNLFLAAYTYVNLGQKMNRFYATFGWSVPLTSDNYVQTGGDPISTNSERALNILSPGGLILGLGFSFAVGN